MDEPRWAIVDSQLKPEGVWNPKSRPRQPYWELTLRMLFHQDSKVSEIRAMVEHVRDFLDEGRSGFKIVRITPAPRPGVYDGLEGASPEECRRQLRNLCNSTMRITHRIMAAIEASDNDGGSASDAIQDMLGILRGDVEVNPGVTLTRAQAEALADWARESERVGVTFDETGVIPGPQDYVMLAPLRDAAMAVAREVTVVMEELDGEG